MKNKLFATIFLFISILFLTELNAQSVISVNGVDVLEKTIIFKIKPEFNYLCTSSGVNIPKLNNVLQQINTENIIRKFPNSSRQILSKSALNNTKQVDLSTIYEIKYNSNIELKNAIQLFSKIVEIEYTEAKIIPKLLFTPSDTDLASQYYLTNIQAYDGWDISKGDTNMVIGISDTGYNFDHPDLANQVKYNYYDPIDGIDNDADGYIDNFKGWDLGKNDNNAQADGVGHGIHVAGLAGAEVNNAFGMAGVGYKCKLLPLKIERDGFLTASYESIVYGADHGCKIINLSWGSTGFSQFGLDIVNYAIFNRNVLLVAAAGNNGTEEKFYPAAYKHVLAVGGTNVNDNKWTETPGGSSFGTFVDVCAPGQAIYSTWYGSGYITSGGTSMASPIVAGAAGIVWSQFPNYNALQIAQQLKSTSDNIYGIPGNEPYLDKLGSGRINLFRALTETNVMGFTADSLVFKDGNDNNFLPNETIELIADFKNYLAPSTNTFVTLSSNSPYISITDNNTNIGAVQSGITVNNAVDPFKFTILNNAPNDCVVELKFTIFDGTYSTIEFDSVVVNPSYFNLTHNSISTSITGFGRIGYNYVGKNQGLGFCRNTGSTLLYEGGLIIGNSPTKVSDCVRNLTNPSFDFNMIQRPQRVIPTVLSEYDLITKFNDNNAGTEKLNVEITQNNYVWNTAEDKNYVVFNYKIINKGSSTLSDFYAGIFTDWDITYSGSNRALLDASNKLGYAYDLATGGNYAATQLLSTSAPMVYYAFDNDNGLSGGINLSDNFTKAEKYNALKTNRHEAGTVDSGSDIITLMSTGPFAIAAGDTIDISFALHATNTYNELIESAKAAKIKFATDVVDSIKKAQYKSNVHLFNNIPNPAEESTLISFYLPSLQNTKLFLYNYNGQIVSKLIDGTLNEGYHNLNLTTSSLNAGIYFYQLETESTIISKKLIIVE